MDKSTRLEIEVIVAKLAAEMVAQVEDKVVTTLSTILPAGVKIVPISVLVAVDAEGKIICETHCYLNSEKKNNIAAAFLSAALSVGGQIPERTQSYNITTGFDEDGRLSISDPQRSRP
jgi:hypothetical protein